MYPAAPGLSPSDRPPPFALLRSFVAAFLRSPGGLLSGAPPKVPCGSRATDIALRAPSRSPPGALRRAFTTRRGFPAKPLQVGRFSPYPSRKPRKTSTGRAFFALPVEKMPQKLYGSAVFWLTCQEKRPNPLQVAASLKPRPANRDPQAASLKPRPANQDLQAALLKPKEET